MLCEKSWKKDGSAIKGQLESQELQLDIYDLEFLAMLFSETKSFDILRIINICIRAPT